MTSRQLQFFRFAFAVVLGMLVATTIIAPTWSWVAFDVLVALATAWVWLVARPAPRWQLRIQRSLADGRSGHRLVL